ncbi:uncharacterized protein LOC132257994 [Phlebotomus argentipes]|uniref:uncharacterized protein LOC132257994 n=1 Tax=Phlebotomus argentipes TaxID=94469 RepID=UPI0028933C34|nr:uncharacterized protein LOC132257994 [Phlebotomus argentipes]
MIELTLLISISLIFTADALLFPRYTVLQCTMAMVLPINIPNRKVALNMGVQVNYNTPWTPAEFYNPPIWQSRSLPEPANETSQHSSYNHVKRDLTAGEFYRILGDILKVQGVENEEECLLKAVCQMAKYPLAHEHDDLIEEVLHFIFTPSVHQSFVDEEECLRLAYEEAEAIGRHHGDCDQHYPNCHRSPIDKLTRLEEISD